MLITAKAMGTINNHRYYSAVAKSSGECLQKRTGAAGV